MASTHQCRCRLAVPAAVRILESPAPQDDAAPAVAHEAEQAVLATHPVAARNWFLGGSSASQGGCRAGERGHEALQPEAGAASRQLRGVEPVFHVRLLVDAASPP